MDDLRNNPPIPPQTPAANSRATSRLQGGERAGLSDAERSYLLKIAKDKLEPYLGDAMPPYPMAALGPLASVCRAIAEGRQVPEAIAGNSVLAVASLLVSGHFDVSAPDGAKPLSVYMLTVAPSGSGKDSADAVATAEIHRWQNQKNRDYEEMLARYEEELAEWSRRNGRKDKPGKKPKLPRAPHRLCADATIEGLRLSFDIGVPAQGLFTTEAAMVLAGYGFNKDNRHKTASVLSDLWERGHISVLRATSGRRFEKYGLRLSCHLAIQPCFVGDIFSDRVLSEGGLWPRFVLAWPRENPPRRWERWNPAEDRDVTAFWDRCREWLDRELGPDCCNADLIVLSAQAEAKFESFFKAMEKEARLVGPKAVIRPFIKRITSIAIRIAGVLAAWRGNTTVSAEDADGGIELAKYSLDCWKTALGMGKRHSLDYTHAIELYQWLLNRPGERCGLRDILRAGPSCVRSADRRDEAIAKLEGAGLVIAMENEIAIAEPPLATSATSATSLEPCGLQTCDSLATPCDTHAPLSQMSQTCRNAQNPHGKPQVANVANVAIVSSNIDHIRQDIPLEAYELWKGTAEDRRETLPLRKAFDAEIVRGGHIEGCKDDLPDHVRVEIPLEAYTDDDFWALEDEGNSPPSNVSDNPQPDLESRVLALIRDIQPVQGSAVVAAFVQTGLATKDEVIEALKALERARLIFASHKGYKTAREHAEDVEDDDIPF